MSCGAAYPTHGDIIYQVWRETRGRDLECVDGGRHLKETEGDTLEPTQQNHADSPTVT